MVVSAPLLAAANCWLTFGVVIDVLADELVVDLPVAVDEAEVVMADGYRSILRAASPLHIRSLNIPAERTSDCWIRKSSRKWSIIQEQK